MTDASTPGTEVLPEVETTGSEEHDGLLHAAKTALESVWASLSNLIPFHAAQGQEEHALNGLKATFDSVTAAVKADAESALTSAAQTAEKDAPEVVEAVEHEAAPIVESAVEGVERAL